MQYLRERARPAVAPPAGAGQAGGRRIRCPGPPSCLEASARSRPRSRR